MPSMAALWRRQWRCAKPGDPEIQDLVARWHKLMNEHFWSRSVEAFRCLGEGHMRDCRFTACYDGVRPGLAAFMRDAMNVYCDRAAGQA